MGGGVIDSQLDGTSEHPLTNKAASAEFLRQQNLIAQKETELRNLIVQANNTITQVNNVVNTVKSTTATTARRGLAQLSTSNNVTDVNAYALSSVEKNPNVGGSLANQIVNHYNAALSMVPGTMYDTYLSQEIQYNDNNDHHICTLQIPVTGIYVISAGIRLKMTAGDDRYGDGITLYHNISDSPTDAADWYRGAGGSSTALPGRVFHLTINPIEAIRAGQYINLVLYAPPTWIIRRYITAVLIRKL